MERFRTVLALFVAVSLLFGYALAQDAGQEQEPAEQQRPAGTEQGTEAEGEAAGQEGAGEEENPDGTADAESDPAVDPALDPDVYDPELDDQTYEGSDDVFVPSEEIPADEPIPFPSDI